MHRYFQDTQKIFMQNKFVVGFMKYSCLDKVCFSDFILCICIVKLVVLASSFDLCTYMIV